MIKVQMFSVKVCGRGRAGVWTHLMTLNSRFHGKHNSCVHALILVLEIYHKYWIFWPPENKNLISGGDVPRQHIFTVIYCIILSLLALWPHSSWSCEVSLDKTPSPHTVQCPHPLRLHKPVVLLLVPNLGGEQEGHETCGKKQNEVMKHMKEFTYSVSKQPLFCSALSR